MTIVMENPIYEALIFEDYIEIHVPNKDEARAFIKKNPHCRFIQPQEGEERCAVLYSIQDLATGGVKSLVKQIRK